MRAGAKRLLLRSGNAFLAVWLVVVLLAYFGAIELPCLFTDLAILAALVVLANMIWKYGVSRSSNGEPIAFSVRFRPIACL